MNKKEEAIMILKDINKRHKIGLSDHEIETVIDAAENDDFIFLHKKQPISAEEAGNTMRSIIQKIGIERLLPLELATYKVLTGKDWENNTNE